LQVQGKDLQVNFQLQPEQLFLSDVIVKSSAEDPAYAIIRKAIQKRKSYENPLDSFTCNAYIKTIIKTSKLPKKY